MFEVTSSLIMFDFIFVTFENESEHGLSRELFGDELLISAVDVTNKFYITTG